MLEEQEVQVLLCQCILFGLVKALCKSSSVGYNLSLTCTESYPIVPWSWEISTSLRGDQSLHLDHKLLMNFVPTSLPENHYLKGQYSAKTV